MAGNGLIGKKVDRYEILEKIGEGGMATVYKAYDTRLEREVAIKFTKREAFPPDQLEMILKRFEREAKALGRLSHPNIVGVIDYGEYDGAPYLVMTYLPGGTLKQKLGKPIPWREAVETIIPIARALHYVHSHNIMNRDVKPSNILLTENGEAMLTDFGLVKLFEGQDTSQQLTDSGVGIGTPDYMAPEQWTGETTALSDMYSLGVVLYEMITGRRPYISDTPAGILLQQVNEPLPLPKTYIPDLPANIEAVLLKTLARNPKDRYANMNAFANDLQSILTGGQVTATAVATDILREQMTGKVSKKEIQEVKTQIEQKQAEQKQAEVPQRERTSPTSISNAGQPKSSKPMVSIALLFLGAVGLLVLCGGCWLAYSFGPWAREAETPTALAVTSPEVPTATLEIEDTPTAKPSDTPIPQVTPTNTAVPILLPQQWNGTYRQAGFNSTPISIVIEKMNGQTFTGKMVWTGGTNYRGAITVIEGEFVTDFGDATEQAKWNKHLDYQNGDRDGIWIKWTETKFVSGGGYTLGGWYYGHVGKDGSMTGIYFLNDQASSYANDSWKLKLVK
ncbi:MAG TPA: protein kinase [Anaerolineales bacterium]|nr:protein kinase [Anaerolineales bacterium]HNE66987.1 protein kinase [Anaerolineales bacterium]HNH77181.1 protein kinase [Anaerolineales bacterium]HNJ13258.1 protein kinase [Anaerolineales bacterium]